MKSLILFILCLLTFVCEAKEETFVQRFRRVLTANKTLGAPERYATLEAELDKPESELGPPAQGGRLPVQTHPNGRMKVLLLVKQGWFTPDMTSIVANNIRVETYSPTGELEGYLEAERAVIDRNQMLAVARGRVFVKMGEETLQGDGAYCDMKEEYVKILNKGEIHTSKMGGEVDLSKTIF